MIKMLNNNETNCISGGWVCSGLYEGELFQKATWYVNRLSENKNFGACHYGLGAKSCFYGVPRNLTGIVNEPIKTWTPARNEYEYIDSYECLEEDASRCIYE